MKNVLFFLLACAPFLQAQRIEHFELRPAADGLRLYITVQGEDRLISSRATKAWQGWTPQTLIYAERLTQGSLAKRLRWYDLFTQNSFTISSGEELEYTDVVPVLLSNNDHLLLVSLRDPQTKAPWVELASPRNGVLLREQFAAWGTAANDRVHLRRFLPADIERTRGDISLLAPDVIATLTLPPEPKSDVAGLYQYTTEERTVTLNLRAGGQGTLVVQKEGTAQPTARQGKWTQTGNEIRFEGMTWVAGVNGLTPKNWDREEWGDTGLPLRRAGAGGPALPPPPRPKLYP